MDQELVSRVLAHINRDRLVSLCADLVSTPSPTGEEGAIGRYIAAWLTAQGVPSYLQEVEEDRFNVIGRVKGSGGGCSLQFNAHMDSSFTGTESDLLTLGEIDPTGRPQAVVANGYISGLGVNNDKGPLAASLEAAAALRQSGVNLPGDLVATGVVGEIGRAPIGLHAGRGSRGKGVGTMFLVTHGVVTDFALVAEPSSFGVTWALPGALYLRLTTRGRPAYTPFTRRDAEGVSSENAIMNMMLVLKAIDRWGARYEKERQYRFPGGIIVSKVNIGAIEGGQPTKPNYSPGICYAYVDVRIPPGVKPLDAFHEVEQVAASAGVPVEADLYLSQPGCDGQGAEPLRAAVENAHHIVFGAPASPIPTDQTSMWNDVNVYNWYGIPSCKYGPSGITYGKKREERLAIDDLHHAAQVYALAALEICSRKRT